MAARELGVTVTHTPHVLTDATADLTIALILAATRRLIEGDDLVRRGGFLGWKPLMLLGTNLTGKRLGIIGMGRIGSAVAKRAHALGMEIVYHARSVNAEAERTWGARRVDFPELLRTSHVISIHCPLTRDTRHLFDREAIAAMRGDAWLINTARGPIVDEVALADALAEGRIAGAGLDVYEHEPAVEPRLLRMPNVVLLPHIASATVETRSEMARIVAEDVRRVLLGGMPLHPVVLQPDEMNRLDRG
ncbi:MAG TPA: D-glycerate dehydrogenase [Thermoanaerobaculia bacterium]|nr:D-glycerate dehydrogenase [Thermoanaerobaculia bacterium]